MKKIVALLLIALMLFATACGPARSDEKKPLPTKDQEVKLHYRDIMVPYDEVEKAERIVLLQTALWYTGRDGIYTEAEVAAPEAMNYDGQSVMAFRMSNVTKFLLNEPTGEVTLYNSNGETVALAAAEFEALRVISAQELDGAANYLDSFQGGNCIILAKDDGNCVMKGFSYAVTAEGEGVLSISAKQELSTADVLTNMGWGAECACNLVASDKFYVPDPIVDGERGAVVAPLSGTTINGKILDASIAQGRINDLLYIEKIVEA